MQYRNMIWAAVAGVASQLAIHSASAVAADLPAPVFDTVFPAGARAGESTIVTVAGRHLELLRELQSNAAGFRCESIEPGKFRLTFPAETTPGDYDLWAVSERGVSSPRTFFVGNRDELLEAEPNDLLQSPGAVPLDVTVNGRIEKGGDVDHFRFEARRGQRIVIECLAHRIDSRLRAVLELFDSNGKRRAVNRGYFGIDPLIDFRAPADGNYTIRVQDLISSGSPEHYYRLDIDTGPRVAFSFPAVVEHGKASRLTLFGWNLSNRGDGAAPASQSAAEFDQIEVEIPAELARPTWPLPVRLVSAQAEFSGFAYHLPGSHATVAVGVTDVSVVTDRTDNHTPQAAQLLTCPCEVSARLADEDERDWYVFQAKRGEVFHIEGLAQRIDSPLDLDISVYDAANGQKLAQFSDSVSGSAGSAFATSHFDPAGRWVAPQDGAYQLVARNLGGGPPGDPRRLYRMSVRREEPDFQLVSAPHAEGPVGLNVRRGGRELFDVVAFRRRGFDGPIRIAARDLPAGVECPDVWIGPGANRGLVVVSAAPTAKDALGRLQLDGFAGSVAPDDANQRRTVRAGTVVRAGSPGGWGRMTSEIPLAIAGEAPVRLSANGHETLNHHLYGNLRVKHSPGGILDVAVDVERRQPEHSATVKLIAAGLPETIANQTAIIPAGQSRGYLSFYLPPNLPLGPYSVVIKGETTVTAAENKSEMVVVYSNPVTFEVEAEAFLVEVDPFAPTRARRGETLQVRYAAQRRNGFIGKMHTELAAPGRVTVVPGLRGRGETFVGQTDHGSLQIVVNDDAPLGRQQFLRLFTVGVREDQPTFFGSCFLPLEIVE